MVAGSVALCALSFSAFGAAPVSLATAPLATSTTSTVQPNLMFILDNSGSMDWQHMPDDASDGGSSVPFKYGYYGLRSSQCNQVYYDPNTTYLPPVDSTGASYPDAVFTSAKVNGYSTAACTSTTCVNLNTSFKASTDLLSDTSGQPAYYYRYNGTQTSVLQRNYNDPTNTFSAECGDSAGSKDASGKILSVAPASSTGGVFTKVTLSSGPPVYTLTFSGTGSETISSIRANGIELLGTPITETNSATMASLVAGQIINITGPFTGYHASLSGSSVVITYPATAAANPPVVTLTNTGNMKVTISTSFATSAEQTNFANWYSYYRTRLLMMKTAAGIAFKALGDRYRVGFMSINTPSDFLNVSPFGTAQKALWYDKLYKDATNGSTPLREALANAGLYYAHKLSLGSTIVVNDPVEYSCQQNFTILSTDGFWNGNAGFQLDGNTAVGNQDGTAPRAMYDGASGGQQTTINYSQTLYSAVNSNKCKNGTFRQRSTQQTFSCTTLTVNGVSGAETCTNPRNGSSTTDTTCRSALDNPNPTPRVQVGSAVTTSVSTGGTSDTLADVAMYYYQTDLRDSSLNNCGGALGGNINVCTNNVFKTGSDNNDAQHMSTFTLGLGASGRMVYASDYESSSKVDGDFYSVLMGSTANSTASPPICSWQADGTVCNWPAPGTGMIENIDDLWHAAVDGHGSYYSATSPVTLSRGISDALAKIATRKGASAAAATSTLNPTNGNNYAYVASYTTVQWSGNLEERTIDTLTGIISDTADWCLENLKGSDCPLGTIVTSTSTTTGSTVSYCVTPGATVASCKTPAIFNNTDPANPTCSVQIPINCYGTMPARVSRTTDTRVIYTASSGTSATPTLLSFTSANFSTSAYFNPSQLSQWSTINAPSTPPYTTATPANLINYLRGQTGFDSRASNLTTTADNRLYRYRETTIGDALESQPVFISKPVFTYADPGYSAFVSSQASRPGTIYMGTNDGALHAISALPEGTSPSVTPGGTERWAYIPSMVLPNLYKLADFNYATNHTNFVNGSPVIADVYCTAACPGGSSPAWRTILVGGLNAGGRGYYTLDITDPTTPILLWEFTPGKASPFGDADMGYSYGIPVVTGRSSDNRWVVLVTSGYNNINPGSGGGYLYVLDAITGEMLNKIGTGNGTIASPSGLSKIAAWNDVGTTSARTTWVYGGDLDGNLWRFDITNPTTAPLQFATLRGPTGGVQPITTEPVLGKINNQKVIFVGTGKYLENADLSDTAVQSFYAIMDSNAPLNNPGGTPRNSSTLIQQTLTLDPTTGQRKSSNNAVDFSKVRGWYVDLPDTGERVNIESKLVLGTLLVATIVPSNTVCSPGGTGWLNYFDYQTGGAINKQGLVSSPYNNPIVGINVLYVQGAPVVDIVTANDPTPRKNEDVNIQPTTGGFSSSRVLWREWNP
jgi:type IV pilus assembly protein PilY1